MKIIYQQKITAIDSMSNEDSSYPKANLIDKQPSRYAKATAGSTVICWNASGPDVALFNIYAETGRFRAINNDATSAINVTGTDLSIADSNTLHSTGTDLSVFSDGDTIVISGFTTAANNGVFTVSGTPTATDLDVSGTPFSAEAAGDTVRVVKATTPDIDVTIDFSWCKSWTDYFSGRARQATQWLYDMGENWTDITCILNLDIDGTKRLGATYPYLGLIYQGLGRWFGKSQYGAGFPIRDSSLFAKTTNGSLLSVGRVLNVDMNFTATSTLNNAAALTEVFKNDNTNYKVFIMQDDGAGLQAYRFIYGKIEQKPTLVWNTPTLQRTNFSVTQVGGYE